MLNLNQKMYSITSQAYNIYTQAVFGQQNHLRSQNLVHLRIRFDRPEVTFDETIVSGLSKLTLLSLSNSNIDGITSGAFRNSNQLTDLGISNRLHIWQYTK